MNYLSLIMITVGYVVFVALYFNERRAATYFKKHYETSIEAYAECSDQAQAREAKLIVALKEARMDAAALAAVVRQYLKDVDETSALLKDPEPPALTQERLAIANHEKLISKPLP